MKFATPYNDVAPSPAIDCRDAPSLVRPEFQHDADINNILARYATTGWLVDPNSPRNDRKPTYDDWSKMPSYQDSLDIVIKAEERFDALPVQIRERFNYDPQKLLDFLNDEKNYDEAVKLRLISPKPDPKPDPTISQAAAAATPAAAGGGKDAATAAA